MILMTVEKLIYLYDDKFPTTTSFTIVKNQINE